MGWFSSPVFPLSLSLVFVLCSWGEDSSGNERALVQGNYLFNEMYYVTSVIKEVSTWLGIEGM